LLGEGFGGPHAFGECISKRFSLLLLTAERGGKLVTMDVLDNTYLKKGLDLHVILKKHEKHQIDWKQHLCNGSRGRICAAVLIEWACHRELGVVCEFDSPKSDQSIAGF
jgi:hypothetical protein